MRNVLILVLVSSLAVAPSVLADGSDTGIVTGTVVDVSGGALPGVKVTLEGGSGERFVMTDDDGVYRFAGVRPGSYKVVAFLDGFTQTEQIANVTAGGRFAFELELSLATEESIIVTSEAPMVDKYNVTAGATVSSETVQEIGATVRSFYGALQVLPGVTNDVESADLSQSRPTINGSLWQESNVYIDGVDTRAKEERGADHRQE